MKAVVVCREPTCVSRSRAGAGGGKGGTYVREPWDVGGLGRVLA